MLRYRVKLSKDTNGTLLVDIPAVPEAHTFGENRDEALWRTVDAVETALMGYIEECRDIPAADGGQRGSFVILPALTEAKLALYQAMRAARVGKAELGRRLNWRLPQVRPAIGFAARIAPRSIGSGLPGARQTLVGRDPRGRIE
jgi:antitoxin HicB